MIDILVHQFLSETARDHPDKRAIICCKKEVTYGELDDRSDRLCHHLRKSGLGKGDRVIIYLPNSVEVAVSVFGVSKAGGVFVVINPDVKRGKLENIVEDCSPTVIITDGLRYRSVVKEMKRDSVRKVILTDEDDDSFDNDIHFLKRIYRNSERGEPADIIDIDLAALIYTSGSTGVPKGVMLTHKNMDSASDSIIKYLKNRQDDIILNALPLSFDYGLYQILMGIKFGGTVALETSFVYVYQILKKVKNLGVTGLPIVPTMGNLIVKMKDEVDLDFSSVRYVTNTAQSLPETLTDKLMEMFPSAEIFSMYGLTECKRVSYLDPSKIREKPTSVGKAMPNTEVYLVDKKGRTIETPDTEGELVVRGSNVMMGYWNREETDKVLRRGRYPWEKVLHTGDIFKFDGDGDLYFVERMDNIIKTAGEKVSPNEVENVLYGIHGIKEAVVVGVDDQITGKALKAVISVEGSISEDDIKKHCSRKLERYMVPKYVEVWERLPRNDNGKIDRKEIRKMVSDKEGSPVPDHSS